MKRMFSLMSLLLLLGLPAQGASPSTKGRIAAPPDQPPLFQPYQPEDSWSGSWTGIYGGLGVGTLMAFGDVTVEGQGGPFSLVDSLGNWDFLGDAKLGYDLRLSNTPFVLGVFGGYSLGRARVDIGSSEVSSLDPTWNAGARIGIVAWNSTLLYTGYKYQWANLDVRQGEEMVGHSIGGHGLIGGIEYPISKAVTLGLEYGYNRFDRVEFCAAGCGGEAPQMASTRPEAHSVMLRGNIRLGFGQ